LWHQGSASLQETRAFLAPLYENNRYLILRAFGCAAKRHELHRSVPN